MVKISKQLREPFTDSRPCETPTAQRKELINFGNQFRTGARARLGIDELGNCGKNGRGAAGGKILNSRTKNGKIYGRNCLNESQRRGNRDINGSGIHLAVREHGNGALMFRLAGVLVEPLVQRGRGGEEIEQQDEAHQQQSERTLVARHQFGSCTPQAGVKLAKEMASASFYARLARSRNCAPASGIVSCPSEI